jgi:CRISPR-associated protein Cmr1
MSRNEPRAPSASSLPVARARFACGAKTTSTLEVRVEVVTPILGGGAQLREVDEVDVIRVPTIRGHLRFWWRALYGHRYRTPGELYGAESTVWGRAAADEGGRSTVELLAVVEQRAPVDQTDIDPQRTPGAYALWPARSERRTSTPPASRYGPGTRFLLRIVLPDDHEAEVRNTVRAWLLFGGYGSRTRRGLGSFTALDNARQWLPGAATRDEFAKLFGYDIFAPLQHTATDVPWLAGASLDVGRPVGDAMQAWTTALEWLKEFRQGTSGGSGKRAREPGTGKPQPQRPSISNWPEADKVRHLRSKTTAHRPRHNATPAWPRAGFGLPIIGRFQKSARHGGRYDEPDGFELRWRSPKPGRPAEFDEHDRLASPLIVKALPLADGKTFAPCALWLNRAYPDGEIFLRGADNSGAPFDRLLAPEDTPQFSALVGQTSLREAFLHWLRTRYGTTVVAS